MKRFMDTATLASIDEGRRKEGRKEEGETLLTFPPFPLPNEERKKERRKEGSDFVALL